MPYSLDFIVAELVCQHCGDVSPDDTSTDLQTALRPAPALEELRVGHRLQWTGVPSDGYWAVHPVKGDRCMLLDVWQCPSCGARQWARIDICGDQLLNVCSVRLTQMMLLKANFISFEATYEPESPGLQGRDLIHALLKPIGDGP